MVTWQTEKKHKGTQGVIIYSCWGGCFPPRAGEAWWDEAQEDRLL